MLSPRCLHGLKLVFVLISLFLPQDDLSLLHQRFGRGLRRWHHGEVSHGLEEPKYLKIFYDTQKYFIVITFLNYHSKLQAAAADRAGDGGGQCGQREVQRGQDHSQHFQGSPRRGHPGRRKKRPNIFWRILSIFFRFSPKWDRALRNLTQTVTLTWDTMLQKHQWVRIEQA